MDASSSREYNVAHPYVIWSWGSFMSETLYMMEMEKLLEELSQDATISDAEELHVLKTQAFNTLTSRFGLNLDDAESQVAAACGEEP